MSGWVRNSFTMNAAEVLNAELVKLVVCDGLGETRDQNQRVRKDPCLVAVGGWG